MPKLANLLGYAGLIPFIGLPLLSLLGIIDKNLAYIYFVQYSAIILSFFGGIHWFDAITNNNGKQHQLLVAMLPSIVAWLSLICLTGTWLLCVLSVAYIGILMYDKYVLALPKRLLFEYISLRVILTSVVVLTHLAMAWI